MSYLAIYNPLQQMFIIYSFVLFGSIQRVKLTFIIFPIYSIWFVSISPPNANEECICFV